MTMAPGYVILGPAPSVAIRRSRMVFATPGICQGDAPENWRQPRFGLSPWRWAELAGKSFWIIGAGTGFGQAIAMAIATAGARVFLSGRRVAKLGETIDMARALGAAP